MTDFTPKNYITTIPFDSRKFIEIDSSSYSNKEYIFSFVISINSKKTEQMKNRLVKNYFFIEAEKFPTPSTRSEQFFSFYNNHIKCIQTAQDMSLDHAFVFEDDVIFIDNWRAIVNEFIKNNDVDIIKFDRIPYNLLSDCPNHDNVYFYNGHNLACCTGGFYYSRRAINLMLDRHKKLMTFIHKEKDACPEDLMGYIQQPLEDKVYYSLPRICIQDWYRQSSSLMQNKQHLKNLSDMQIEYYLPRYGKFYPEFINEKNN